MRCVSVGVLGVSVSVLLLAMSGELAAQTPIPVACAGDNGGLSLSAGFCATVFADNLGHVRHLVAAPDGTLYANT